jgi:hypothetical protein
MNTSVSQKTMVHEVRPVSRMRVQSSENSESESTTSPSTGWRVLESYRQLSICCPTPGLLGACSRAQAGSVCEALTTTEGVAALRALRALPARALPLPDAGLAALARHGRGR